MTFSLDVTPTGSVGVALRTSEHGFSHGKMWFRWGKTHFRQITAVDFDFFQICMLNLDLFVGPNSWSFFLRRVLAPRPGGGVRPYARARGCKAERRRFIAQAA